MAPRLIAPGMMPRSPPQTALAGNLFGAHAVEISSNKWWK